MIYVPSRGNYALDIESIRYLLKREVEAAGSIANWARLHSSEDKPMHRSVVSIVLAGKADPTPQILEALGLKIEVIKRYTPIEGS